jgi:hypothetical protein
MTEPERAFDEDHDGEPGRHLRAVPPHADGASPVGDAFDPPEAPQALVDEQYARVLEHLEKRERITSETKRKIEEAKQEPHEALADVDPEIRLKAEDDFYAALGKKRYVSSDGRVMFLSDEEIRRRRHVREKKERTSNRYYFKYTSAPSAWRTWGFNVLAVGLGLAAVWVILNA